MGFTNSPLATYTRISPNKNSPRTEPITKITVHHMAGALSIETFGNIVASPARQMSANYAIGNDGRIGLFCDEGDRSWCSSSPWNDHRAITIEVSNSAVGGEWPIGEAAYNSLVDLCVDICKRNGIPKLEFTGDKNGSLTFHYMFAQTSCFDPYITELLTPDGWKYLKDINVGDMVASAHIDNLSLTFEPVLNKVPEYVHDTWKVRDIETTADHRILAYNQAGRQYVYLMKDFMNESGSMYIPNAGYMNNTPGLANLSKSDIEFLIAVQADGHYMKDGKCLYGIEFHLSKERKIKRLRRLFDIFKIDYKEARRKDGTTMLRLYGKKYVEKAEMYLRNKSFTWEWLQLSPQQASWFLEIILEYDGCKNNNSYSSSEKINTDVVQAIASIHGVGTKLYIEDRKKENHRLSYRVYFKKPMRSRGTDKPKRKTKRTVSCVTVPTGFILVRQHGRTTIIGNCPGPWMKAHAQDLCDKVNARLGNSSSTVLGLYTISLSTGDRIYDSPDGAIVGEISASTKYTIVEEKTIAGGYKYGKLKSGAGWVIVERPAAPTSSDVKTGDLVAIKTGAKYYNGGTIPSWVADDRWYVSSLSGDRAVLGANQSGKNNIQSAINTNDIFVVSSASSGSTATQTVTLDGSTVIYDNPGGRSISTVGAKGVYTIVETQSSGGAVYGKLKSGAGWVIISGNAPSTEINVGDWVKVLNPIIYGTNQKFVVYVDKYKVLEISGDRCVISSDGRNVTSAIAKKNLQKL